MIKHLLLLFLPLFIFAESSQISTVPVPLTYIQVIDVDLDCDEDCLEQHLADGEIFTFLAIAQEKLDDEMLDNERMIYIGLFNIGSDEFVEEQLRIAMILPYKVIGRYAHSTSNAVFAYLITRNHEFELKNFQIEDESEEAMQAVLQQIKDEGFRYVIAPLTPRGAQVIVDHEEELEVYFPTINKRDLNTSASNIYFGAIDYQAQIDALTPRASSPMVVMYDKSVKGKNLYAMTKESYNKDDQIFQPTSRKAVSEEMEVPYEPELEPKKKRVIGYGINRKSTNMKWYFEENEKIQFGSFFLHTPIIKSTMILSQFTTYDTNTTNVLSTQLNYDPLLLSMTQQKDRNNLYIANSININNSTLIEANSLLSNDIAYDWINYASTLGVDYFFNKITKIDRIYKLPFKDNQLLYPISIVSPEGRRFKVIEEGVIPVVEENNVTEEDEGGILSVF